MTNARIAVGLVFAVNLGCVGGEDDVGDRELAASEPGDWSLPHDVRVAGDRQYLHYDAAPPWDGGRNCSGGLLAGTREVGDFLLGKFDGPSRWGGYACRQNTADSSRTSVHGTGRALDVMVPMDDGRADNGKGDPVANWLVTHSETVGCQYIIWDRSDWGAHRDAPKLGDYGGPIPHIDHVHMELTEEAAARRTPFFTDRDDDGVRNEHDNCPGDANGGQTDADGDDRGNVCDNYPHEANAGQRDSDDDGIGNVCDLCPHVKNPEQNDTDGDGRGNVCDNCDAVENRWQVDTDGDGRGDACDGDDDDDGIEDDLDDCRLVANAAQADANGDGVGNACQDDDDGDGVLDSLDVCRKTADPEQLDGDGDGVGDVCDDSDDDGLTDATDVCPRAPDPAQDDLDGDLVGDACDEDLDGDGVRNARDGCPDLPDPEQSDLDGDGIGDACDPDADADGVLDDVDLCPAVADADQADGDADGVGDACDPTPDVSDEEPERIEDDDGPSPVESAQAIHGSAGCSAAGAGRGEWMMALFAALALRRRVKRRGNPVLAHLIRGRKRSSERYCGGQSRWTPCSNAAWRVQ